MATIVPIKHFKNLNMLDMLYLKTTVMNKEQSRRTLDSGIIIWYKKTKKKKNYKNMWY